MEPTKAHQGDRLYQELARKLMDELSLGKYPLGSRLPAERELALQYEVSRPTVREAIIALEVQGLVEVRIGSGAYVQRLPGKGDVPGFNISAFELTEARLLFEGEAAALAAANNAVAETVENLWRLRYTSPEAALLHEKARTANVKPVVDEHTAILDALRARDPAGARAAMREHLSAVLESLLFATEEKAIAAARRAVQAKRDRYARATA